MKFIVSIIGNFIVFLGYTFAMVGGKLCDLGLGIHKYFNTPTGLKVKKYEEQLNQFVNEIKYTAKEKEMALEDMFKSDRGGNA